MVKEAASHVSGEAKISVTYFTVVAPTQVKPDGAVARWCHERPGTVLGSQRSQ